MESATSPQGQKNPIFYFWRTLILMDQCLIDTTSSPQRASVMKLQFLTYRKDAAHLQWISEHFTELYSGPDANEV